MLPERIQEKASLYRRDLPAFATWAAGYGECGHSDALQVEIFEFADLYARLGICSREKFFRILHAADRLTSAALWLVAHSAYTNRARAESRELAPDDFLHEPAFAPGPSFALLPFFVGFFAANAISGHTRGWIGGRGNDAPAVEAVNALVGNSDACLTVTDEGLTAFVQRLQRRAIVGGEPPLPSALHLHALSKGVVLAGTGAEIAALAYPHVPLPGERLVALLNAQTLELHGTAVHAPRWWRHDDCGLVAPIVLCRHAIDAELVRHASACGHVPRVIDGTDPAAAALAILIMDEDLAAAGKQAAQAGHRAAMPMAFAVAAEIINHSALPLEGQAALDPLVRERFQEAARTLWVPRQELETAVATLAPYPRPGRPGEAYSPLVNRRVDLPNPADVLWRSPRDLPASPMQAIDVSLSDLAEANGQLRLRVACVGDAGQFHIERTTAQFKRRVIANGSEAGGAMPGQIMEMPDALSALAATLGNQGGMNMLFAGEAQAALLAPALCAFLRGVRLQRRAQTVGWLGLPLVITNLLWEANGAGVAAQDTTFAEAAMAEACDVSRVLYPVDWNSAHAALHAAYRSHGMVWSLIAPRERMAHRFTREQAQTLVRNGALSLQTVGPGQPMLSLAACGAYALTEALRASERLRDRQIGHNVVYLMEPARFRAPRDPAEGDATAPEVVRTAIFPASIEHIVLLTHTRPEGFPRIMPARPSVILGFMESGGALDVRGLLYENRCTWAHALRAAGVLLGRKESELLDPKERDALDKKAEPSALYVS